MKTDWQQAGTWTVARIAGALTADNSDGLLSQLRAHFHQHKPEGYVFDLGGVDLLDSVGIGSLVACLHHVRKAGGDLRLAAAGGKVLMALKLARADHVFQLHPTADAALRGA